jgi:hypothetical protein
LNKEINQQTRAPIKHDLAALLGIDRMKTVKTGGEVKKPGESGIVLYAADFSDLPAVENATAAMPAETVANAIFDQRLRDAREEGFAAGLLAAREEVELERRALEIAALQEITFLLKRGAEDLSAIANQAAHETAGVLAAILGSALPYVSAHHGAEEIAGMVVKILPELQICQQNIIANLSIHGSLLPMIEKKLAAFVWPGAPPVLIADDLLAPGDARLVWQGGMAVRDIASLQKTIGAILAELGLTGDRYIAPAGEKS